MCLRKKSSLAVTHGESMVRRGFPAADVPEEWAATMSLGVVAGRARGALVDACAAYRARDSQVQCYTLIDMPHLLSTCL